MNNLFVNLNIISQAFFHVILKNSLYAGILFIVFFPVAFLLKKRIPKLVHGLWFLVLLRLFLPLELSLPYSIAQYIPFQKTPLSFAVGEDIIEDVNTYPLPKNDVETSFRANTVYPILLLCLLILWIALSIYYLQVNMKMHILVNKSKTIRIVHKTRIITSNDTLSPFSFGLFKPVIYIPRHLLNTLTEQEINIIIFHELAHLKHRDQFWVWIDSLIKIVYFYNPLVWWILHERQKLREWIADDEVLVRNKVQSKEYVQCLVSILKFNLFDSYAFQWAPGIGHRRSHIKHRIKRLKGDHFMSKIPALIWVMVLLAAGWLLLPMTGSMESGTVAAEKPTIKDGMDPVFINPLMNGTVSSRYGMRMHPVYKEKRLHEGIDIKAKSGTPIHAAAEGVVLKVVEDYEPGKGYGMNLILQHEDGFQTRYCQLGKILVEEGQEVNSMTVIAEVGSSGMSTGPHLHFELIKDGERINPETYIQF